MSRIRTIKPEFWSDEKISEVSRDARLLFIGIWNYADDYGNIERSSKQMKARIFPYDSDIDCEALLNELIDKHLVIQYSAEENNYVHVRGFNKHQKIDKPSKARFPYPQGDNYENTHGVLDEGSPLEGNGKEGNGKGVVVDRKEGENGKNGENGEIKESPQANPSLVVMSIEDLRKQMTGEIFIDQACMTLHTDPETFRQFVEDWCNTKAITQDFHYPIGRLRGFLLSDFKNQKKVGINNVKRSKMDDEEVLRLAEKLAAEQEGGTR